jgi:integrase/recombinase XerD
LLFLEDRRSAGRVHRQLTLEGLRPLLGYLRGLGVVPEVPSPATAVGPLEDLLEEFTDHLTGERGLVEQTVKNYRRAARSFLSARCGLGDDGVTVGDLTAEDVIGFVLAEATRLKAGSLGNTATGLWALLRFLYVQGYTVTSLAAAVPAGPGWRDSGLPRAAEPAQVARLLASCDRRTTSGRRDFAILTMLARLGLRSGEVAALSIDDVDWRAGELAVTGKGNRRELLPLPHDVGQAMAAYCQRGRRCSDSRSLFLHVRAPYVAMSPSAVRQVVARAGDRSGIGRLGAHQLRHATATAMRRAGAPLLEIGQVLRHRHAPTTAHYARDDLDALVVVARPWLGGAA